jgi:nucleotide-binding universal stress UspA family protein
MKILLSIDPTKNSQAIARCWGQFPIPSDTDLYLLQVVEVGDNQIAVDHSRVWERTFTIARTAWMKEAKAFLEKIRKYFPHIPKSRLNSFTAEGIPGEEILRIITTHRIDLVALGNRGLSGIKRFLLGSTSDRVLREAPCSVAIFRNKSRYAKKSSLTKKFKILLVSEGPTDGLPNFEMLQSLNFFGSSSISVLHVVEEPNFLTNWFFAKKSPKLIEAGKELMKRAQRSGQKHVREVIKKLDAHGIKTKSFFATGNPADEILKTEKRVKPDFIVIGAYGWTEGTPLPLGGVARKVARYAKCSVLVVRPKG